MRVQSIIGSFVIVLGNPVLHLTLAILAAQTQKPDQEDIDRLLDERESKDNEYNCVAASDLSSAIEFTRITHLVIFVLLLYMELHTPIWSRIVSFLRANNYCCYRKKGSKILREKDVQTLEHYNQQMKYTWKVLQEMPEEAGKVKDVKELLKVGADVSFNSNI